MNHIDQNLRVYPVTSLALIACLVLAGCKGKSGGDESDDSESPVVGVVSQVDTTASDPSPPSYDDALDVVSAKLDIEAPVPGGAGALSVSAIKADGLKVSFAKATDNKSKATQLQYALFYSTASTMKTVAEVESHGTAAGPFTADVSQVTMVAALQPATTYYFNVIVKDAKGNRSAYARTSATTGQFPTVGGAGVITASQTNMDVVVSWSEGLNGNGDAGGLKYGLFRSASANLASVTDVLDNGTQVGVWTTDIDELTVVNPGTAVRLHLNVLVRDAAGNHAAYTPIVFDTNASLHIAYVDLTNRDLKYARRTGTTWDAPVVADATGDIYQYTTSIAVDAAGKAHIAYYLSTGLDLYYANNVSGSFDTQAVATAGTVGLYANIGLTSDEQPFFIAYDGTTTDLMFYFEFAGSWSSQAAHTNAAAVGQYASMVLDANDKIHVAHYNATSFDLLYSTNKTGVWVTETVEATGTTGQFPSIGLDSQGFVHISSYSVTDLRLHYSTNASGVWVTELPDNAGSSGQYSSLAIGSDDSIHISYYSLFNTNLRYLTKEAAGSWSAPVDVDGATTTTGIYNTTIRLDRLNRPYISYHDDTANTLKCAYRLSNGGAWTVDVVDAGGGTDVGRSSSLAVQ